MFPFWYWIKECRALLGLAVNNTQDKYMLWEFGGWDKAVVWRWKTEGRTYLGSTGSGMNIHVWHFSSPLYMSVNDCINVTRTDLMAVNKCQQVRNSKCGNWLPRSTVSMWSMQPSNNQGPELLRLLPTTLSSPNPPGAQLHMHWPLSSGASIFLWSVRFFS